MRLCERSYALALDGCLMHVLRDIVGGLAYG